MSRRLFGLLLLVVVPGTAATAAGAAQPPGAAARPITVEVGLRGERQQGFLDKLLTSDTERSEDEVARWLRERPWLEVVGQGGEVLFEVTRRSIAEGSRNTQKDGKVSVSWRYTLRGTIRSGQDRQALEVSSTSTETLSESEAGKVRRETYADTESFDRLAHELADKANDWILDRVDALRPDRPDAGFRSQPKYRFLLKGDGLEVTAVAPGSPAARAGLLVGDRIRAIDDQKGTNEMYLRARTWWVESPGTRVRLEFERNKVRQAVLCEILPPPQWEAGRGVEPAAAREPAAAAGPAPGARVKPGMRGEEVERLLGRPKRVVSFESKTVWTYDGFRVVFQNGAVSDVQ